MFYTVITYRQRGPNGSDLPRAACETTRNGPFTTRAAAEHFATAVANTTAVLNMTIDPSTEVGEEEEKNV